MKLWGDYLMSGINELKEKSKKQLQMNEKRKMGLGEMFDDQTVGKPDIQKDGNPEIQQTNRLDNQQPTNPINRVTSQPEVHPPITQTFHQSTFPPTQTDVKPEPHPARQPIILSKQSKNQRVPTCKMTFNLREDIHKAFNDLYANRILQGRATEKSEMICEAIQLLISMEEQENN